MIKVYSNVVNNLLLHVVCRIDEIQKQREERIDLIEDDQYIQCATLKLNEGKTFRPHKHIKHRIPFTQKRTQESWVVIQGAVMCKFYDIDDTIIATPILKPGDASFTLNGGHTYEILEDNTIVYEFKTGPYQGVENDKKFI